MATENTIVDKMCKSLDKIQMDLTECNGRISALRVKIRRLRKIKQK